MENILCLLLTLITISVGAISPAPFLDLDEINLVQYDVKIGDEPIVLDTNDQDPPPVQVSF